MGDGRFYTDQQFYTIMYLTILLIFSVVSFMIAYYKGQQTKSIGNLLFSYAFCIFAILLSFYETVLVDVAIAKHVCAVVFILMVQGFLVTDIFLLRHFSAKSKKEKAGHSITNILIVLQGLYLVWQSLNGQFGLLRSYSFEAVSYRLTVTIICLVLLLFSMLARWLNYRVTRKKKQERRIIHIATLFITVPILVITLIATLYPTFLHLMILPSLGILSIGITILAYYIVSYRVSASIFGAVKDMIEDYVLITDAQGLILYKSQRFEASETFADVVSFSLDSMEDCFAVTVTKREAYKKVFLHLDHPHEQFLQYAHVDVIKDDRVVGKIVTFTDITSLIVSLDKLESEKKELREVHRQLSTYKEIVYAIEREKEVHHLMTEITKNQYQSTVTLKKEIQGLSKTMELTFIDDVEVLIKQAKSDLRDVRAAVSQYREYYDGRQE